MQRFIARQQVLLFYLSSCWQLVATTKTQLYCNTQSEYRATDCYFLFEIVVLKENVKDEESLGRSRLRLNLHKRQS